MSKCSCTDVGVRHFVDSHLVSLMAANDKKLHPAVTMESLSSYDDDPSVKLSNEGDDVSEEWEMPFDTMVDVNEAKKMQENEYIKDLMNGCYLSLLQPKKTEKAFKEKKSKVYFT